MAAAAAADNFIMYFFVELQCIIGKENIFRVGFIAYEYVAIEVFNFFPNNYVVNSYIP